MPESLSLLHPLKIEIVEFLEDEHDLQFKVEFPAPEFCTACGAIGQSIRFSKRYTNALTESINRYLRDVNRNARGLSFEMFRAKIMFTLEHKVKPPETKRLAPFLAREIMAVEPIEDELVDYGVPIFSILQLYSEPETGAFQEEG